MFSAIFERLRSVLHEGQIELRVQYMVEVIFATRKDGFKVLMILVKIKYPNHVTCCHMQPCVLTHVK